MDFSPAHGDGVLFSCDEAGACRLWNAGTGEEIAQLAPPQGGGARAQACLGALSPLRTLPLRPSLHRALRSQPRPSPPAHWMADMPRATFFRCKSAVDEEGIVLLTPMKWKREGWIVKWRQVLRAQLAAACRHAAGLAWLAPCPAAPP